MTWTQLPLALGVALALPLLAAVAWWGARQRRRGMRALLGEVNRPLERVRALRVGLLILGLASVCVALARPQAGFTLQERPVVRSEVNLVLDLSRSMDAQDVEPSRLGRAKRDIQDLVETLVTQRVGLTIYAGGAHARVPLTSDRIALLRVVETLETYYMRAQGSELGAGIDTALGLFGEQPGAARAIVVFSDGESWDEELEEAVGRAKEHGVRIYAVGVGTPQGAPIPLRQGGFHEDRSGEVVLSRLEEDTLTRIARETGGAYVRSSAGAADTRALSQDLLRALRTGEESTSEERVPNEVFQLPLAIGIALIALAGLIGEAWPRLAPALAVGLLLFSGVAHADEVDLRQMLNEGRYPQALAESERLLAKDPDDVGLTWARAEALYRMGRYEEAARAYDELAERARDPRIQTEAQYNAGNANYRAGRLDDALEDWTEVLVDDPDHSNAQRNLEQVTREREQRLQLAQEREEQQQEEQPDQGEDQPQQGEDEQPQQPQQGEDQPEEGESDQTQGQGDSGDPGAGDQQEPQDGSEGEPEGEPEEEDHTDASSQDPSSDEVESQPPSEQPQGQTGNDEGTMDEREASPQADLGEQGGQEGELPEVEAGVGELSEEEARRLTDAVEEGTPRVPFGGVQGGKDW